MATNRELRELASTLGQELGVEVNTEGLGNSSLAALVADLQAQKAGRGDAPAPSGDEAVSSVPPTPQESPKPLEPPPDVLVDGDPKPSGGAPKANKRAPRVPFYVAPRKAITTIRGVLDEYQPIGPSDVVEGDRAAGLRQLEHLAARGLVIKT